MQGSEHYELQAEATGVPDGFVVPPVQNQPTTDGKPCMPIPASVPNCPPGLEYLTQIDQILIHQQLEFTFFNILTDNKANKYELKNALGQRLYFAEEDYECCNKEIYGSSRPFTIRITDNLGQEVMMLQRPSQCLSCCFVQELEVQAPPGTTVGYVVQNWHACLPKFTIQDEKRTDILKIIGPFAAGCCCADDNFEVKSVDETSRVGRISNLGGCSLGNLCSEERQFEVSFSMDLDVKMKAVMIGACFLIDFMFYEPGYNHQASYVAS